MFVTVPLENPEPAGEQLVSVTVLCMCAMLYE